MKIQIPRQCSAALGLALLALGGCPGLASAQTLPNPIPIPQQPDALPVPTFIGSPAVPKKIEADPIPQNPYMAAGSWSNAHNDAYMSDLYRIPGPLGHAPVVSSTWLGTPRDPVALAPFITFDGAGRIVVAAVRFDSADNSAYVQLTLIDPDSLATLARFNLPKESRGETGFRPSGTYFYLDNQDRVVIGTRERTVWVLSHTATSFKLEATYDLTGAIAADDSIEALQPDWSGRVWFTSKGGVVGTLDMETGAVRHTRELQEAGERIVNGHAADEEGGVYIVSTRAMYRFDADAGGAPKVSWRTAYDAGTHVKEGQVDIGSGTTPTLMGKDYVAITDNGQPQMRVLVYRRAREIAGDRLVCSQPVFQPGNAANENSLIATEKSIIVENNFGYKAATKDTTHGRTTKPGMARIDLDAGSPNGCRIVWSNEAVSIPSVISKMSLGNGLIYTYTKPRGPATTDAWYFTAIDFRSGQVAYKQLAGTGILYNNHYAGVSIGPDGTLYVGALGGVVALRDGYAVAPGAQPGQ